MGVIFFMEERLNYRNLYYQNVKQILESKRIFAKGFTNYYGKEHEDLINDCMNQMFYHIYKPSEDIMKSEKKKESNNAWKMKLDILKILLQGLSSNTNQNILLKTNKQVH